jgi:hypothetical protein
MPGGIERVEAMPDGYQRRRLMAGDRCDVDGCENVATMIEARSFTIDGDGNDVHPGIFVVCHEHDGHFLSDCAEYSSKCPNCGCSCDVN